jgi:hypothetical protein
MDPRNIIRVEPKQWEEDAAGTRMLERLNLSYVRRWVIAPTFRDQSVAEHTFRVMAIAFYLQQRVPDGPSISIWSIMDWMDHDLDEVFTGDCPGPDKDKKGESGLKDISTMTYMECLVKVADSIETGTFWVVWGNPAWNHQYANAPQRDLNKIAHYSRKMTGLHEAAMEVWYAITAGR